MAVAGDAAAAFGATAAVVEVGQYVDRCWLRAFDGNGRVGIRIRWLGRNVRGSFVRVRKTAFQWRKHGGQLLIGT